MQFLQKKDKGPYPYRLSYQVHCTATVLCTGIGCDRTATPGVDIGTVLYNTSPRDSSHGLTVGLT
jgi:hypothetical protein